MLKIYEKNQGAMLNQVQLDSFAELQCEIIADIKKIVRPFK